MIEIFLFEWDVNNINTSKQNLTFDDSWEFTPKFHKFGVFFFIFILIYTWQDFFHTDTHYDGEWWTIYRAFNCGTWNTNHEQYGP